MTEAARWAGSLRLRLLGATLMAALVALALAGALLASLFRDHVQRQFAGSLTAQLDQVTARLEFDAAGEPRLDTQALSDPRWSRPLSGLYWQVDGGDPTARRRGLLRSRSLWDAELAAPPDTVADGQVHVHETTGPNSSALLLVERTVRRGDGDPRAWRVLVAGDRQATEAAVARFNGILLVSLAALLALLCAAAVAQVAVGLAPLRGLQRALNSVHAGRSARLEGRFPSEVQPLIDDFNAVLDRNAEVVARARQEAGNLAHAIKTPLAAMAQAAAAAPDARADLAPLVQEQVGVARRHVEWHLARARAAASQRLPGARAALAPVLAALLRVMQRVHAERRLSIACEPIDPDWALAGEVQDLQEIVGNVLDNACKWARHSVHVNATREPGHNASAGPDANKPGGDVLHLTIEDDGPGVGTERRDAMLARGARLDESVPGSGLGLAIVQDLVGLYGGRLTLGTAGLGGLRVDIVLPATPGADAG